MKETFFYTNFFVGSTTLLVGAFAIFLYFRQKKDKKREIAKLILQEVRYAEQMIKEFKRHNQYKLHDRLLPTNNWNLNIHMFVSDFSETEIDSISKFYAQVSYIDVIIQKISDQNNDPETVKKITDELQRMRESGQTGTVAIQMVSPISDLVLKDTSLNVEFLYNTPAAEKLRKLSKGKLYQI